MTQPTAFGTERIIKFRRQPWHEHLERAFQGPSADTEDTEEGSMAEAILVREIELLTIALRSVSESSENYEEVVDAVESRIQIINDLIRLIPGGLGGVVADRPGGSRSDTDGPISY